MITIDILCSTPLPNITGQRRDKVQVMDGCTVKELLPTLSELYGLTFNRLGLAENPFIVMLINGQSIHSYGLETKLKQGDSILMNALMAGG